MFNNTFLKLTKRFYPRGRAFNIPAGSIIEKYHKALIESENSAYTAAVSVLDSILPDNDNFTAEDATDWERRLGLITNTSLTLDQRKQAIERKMNHPGTIKARQHYLYVQKYLQDQGFDVYVHENRFFELGMWVTKTPAEVIGVSVAGQAVHTFDGSFLEHGQVQHGGGFSDKIANSIDKELDLAFDVGANLRSTFFIGGQILGTFASVDITREVEFRQAVLRVKPVHSVAFPFINYSVGGSFNNDFSNDFKII